MGRDMTWVQFAKSMWAEWWLVLVALALVLLVLLGLLWLVIEFPGLTGWKVVHKESPEGRARQERWRRDSLVIEQKEKRGKRRLRKVGVDQGVQCLMEVEQAEKVEENFQYRLTTDQQARARSRQREAFMERMDEELVVGEESPLEVHSPLEGLQSPLVRVHSPVSTDDEDSGVFPHHNQTKRKERREWKSTCKGSSVVIVIAGGGGQHQRGHKDHSVLDSLDLALGPHTVLRQS